MRKQVKFLSFLMVLAVTAVLVFYLYPPDKINDGVIVDKIVVYKSKRTLIAYSKGEKIATYSIALGKNPLGHKELEGDGKTPEGVYTINDRNANSGYHKNLGISYPNDNDKAHAKALGQSPGGDVKIHGLKNGKGYIGRFHLWNDWTNGCIAVDNKVMDELYNHVALGSTIEIHK